jgi:hypothetical protein
MPSDHAETASQALREFGRRVVRDGIDSAHLGAYIQALLASDLVEPHARCRYEAKVLTRCFPCLQASEVGAHYADSARRLEGRSAMLPEPTSWELRPRGMNRRSRRRMASPVPLKRCGAADCPQPSCLPELIGALGFLAASIVVFWVPEQGNFVLRSVAAGLCGFLGFAYAVAAVAERCRGAHPKHSAGRYRKRLVPRAPLPGRKVAGRATDGSTVERPVEQR